MIQNQTYVFLWSIFIGVILALIFDLFRILRRKGNTKTYVVCIQDIIYWLIVTFIIIMSAFITNDGELRGYMFIGYILGAVVYILTISQYLRKIIGTVLDFFEKCCMKILNLIKKIFTNFYVYLKKINSRTKKC